MLRNLLFNYCIMEGCLFGCFATLILAKPHNATCHIFDISLESSQWNEWVGGCTKVVS